MNSLFVLPALSIGAIQARESGRVFSVNEYGTNGIGVAENAASIQKAIDAAAAAGGGVVLFPAGEYRTATVFLKDNVTAAYTFDDPSGNYDIRITYFDEEVGHSPVQLFVAGREVLSFKLNEDVDCWRWRRFENIKVNKGDEIKLVAESDRKE